MLRQGRSITHTTVTAPPHYRPSAGPACLLPLLLCCRDTADSLRDFFYGVGHNRVQGATNMMLEAFHWLQSHHPYW